MYSISKCITVYVIFKKFKQPMICNGWSIKYSFSRFLFNLWYKTHKFCLEQILIMTK